MSGYWGGEGDADAFDPDGFIRTGDLGRLVDGLLFITGRSKDMVIRGGENIAAAHVESVLLRHPAVSVAAVVGLPHADLGEEVGAAVVPASGADVSVSELASFAAERLAHFEVPSKWWVHPGPLPTGDTGKLDKRALRAAWLERA
jgi:long-chain acyl-CoA synthetase